MTIQDLEGLSRNGLCRMNRFIVAFNEIGAEPHREWQRLWKAQYSAESVTAQFQPSNASEDVAATRTG